MKVTKVWFEGDDLCAMSESGEVLRQSLLWYPRLRQASEAEREAYEISSIGIHWRGLDEDASFESFYYDDAEPTDLQRFFLTHREINVSEFAKRIGINSSLLRNYINGSKKPSPEREAYVLAEIQKLGEEILAFS